MSFCKSVDTNASNVSKLIEVTYFERIFCYITAHIYKINAQREYDIEKKHPGDIHMFLYKDVNGAIDAYKTSSKKGDAYALFRLGYCYNKGIGVIKSLIRAKRYYMLSACQGDPFGQVYLGLLYLQGMPPFVQQINRAINLFMLSVEKHNAYAQYVLGLCYYNGDILQMNRFISVSLWERSAIRGLKEAQYYLALCYEDGICTTKNYKKALMWYKRSAKQGYEHAIVRLRAHHNDDSACFRRYRSPPISFE
jgi:TPR repeat protein